MADLAVPAPHRATDAWAGTGALGIAAALEKHGFEVAPLLKEKAAAKAGF